MVRVCLCVPATVQTPDSRSEPVEGVTVRPGTFRIGKGLVFLDERHVPCVVDVNVAPRGNDKSALVRKDHKRGTGLTCLAAA